MIMIILPIFPYTKLANGKVEFTDIALQDETFITSLTTHTKTHTETHLLISPFSDIMRHIVLLITNNLDKRTTDSCPHNIPMSTPKPATNLQMLCGMQKMYKRKGRL